MTSHALSAAAVEFIPGKGVGISTILPCYPQKIKKTKDQRAAPRKRRRNKSRNTSIDQLSDNISELSQGSGMVVKSRLEPVDDDITDDIQQHMTSADRDDSSAYSHQIRDFNAWFQSISLSRDHRGAVPTFEFHSGTSSSSSISPEEINHDQKDWLEMQQKWISFKYALDVNELESETLERRKWSLWAISAAEVERLRRMNILKEIDEEQQRERMNRRHWAVQAIEQERHDRISQQFLMSLVCPVLLLHVFVKYLSIAVDTMVQRDYFCIQ